jgi:hypothetical protein
MAISSSPITAALGTALFVLSVGVAAPAWSVEGTATDKYISGKGAQFESLAGSHENLESLAGGLRTGTRVTLTENTPTGIKVTTFDPPTKPMGYGNITRALTLANRQLASVGITDPTAAELRAALNGGTVKTASGDTQLQGVLQLRSQHMGWGKIAHTIGVPPGNNAGAGAPHVTPHIAARSSGGTVTNAGGATVGSASSRGHGNGHGAIVSAAGSSSTVSPGRSGNAFGRGPVSTAAGTQGPGNGNAFGHGRAGK